MSLLFREYPATDNKRCKKCRYSWGPTSGMNPVCVYILHTGRRRGCPGGSRCDKFEKQTRSAEERMKRSGLL